MSRRTVTIISILALNVIFAFGVYNDLMKNPNYWDKRNHKCLVTHKVYEGPYETRSGSHTHGHEPRYLLVLRDELNRSFYLNVTIPTYINHEVGEYLNFSLSEDDIAVSKKARDNEMYGEMLETLNALIFIVALFCLFIKLDN